eukprot:764957-Hanusia_phi.AAC.3
MVRNIAWSQSWMLSPSFSRSKLSSSSSLLADPICFRIFTVLVMLSRPVNLSCPVCHPRVTCPLRVRLAEDLQQVSAGLLVGEDAERGADGELSLQDDLDEF